MESVRLATPADLPAIRDTVTAAYARRHTRCGVGRLGHRPGRLEHRGAGQCAVARRLTSASSDTAAISTTATAMSYTAELTFINAKPL